MDRRSCILFALTYEMDSCDIWVYFPWVGDIGHIPAGAAHHSVASALGSAFPA